MASDPRQFDKRVTLEDIEQLDREPPSTGTSDDRLLDGQSPRQSRGGEQDGDSPKKDPLRRGDDGDSPKKDPLRRDDDGDSPKKDPLRRDDDGDSPKKDPLRRIDDGDSPKKDPGRRGAAGCPSGETDPGVDPRDERLLDAASVRQSRRHE